MSEKLYDLVFCGELMNGADPDEVRVNLAKLFNSDAAGVERLFSKQKVLIKKALDEASAQKYRTAFGKAGAIIEIIDSGSLSATPKPKAAAEATAPEPPKSEPAPEPAAEPAVTAVKEEPKADAQDTEAGPVAPDLGVADPGAQLVEPQTTTAAVFAIDHLEMAEAGVTLIEPVKVPAPEYDLSKYALDPPGTILAEPLIVEAPTYDLESLNLTLVEMEVREPAEES